MSDNTQQVSTVLLNILFQSLRNTVPAITDAELARIGNAFLENLAQKLNEGYQPAAVKFDADGLAEIVVFSFEKGEFKQDSIGDLPALIPLIGERSSIRKSRNKITGRQKIKLEYIQEISHAREYISNFYQFVRKSGNLNDQALSELENFIIQFGGILVTTSSFVISKKTESENLFLSVSITKYPNF